jgi:hypothetical protein
VGCPHDADYCGGHKYWSFTPLPALTVRAAPLGREVYASGPAAACDSGLREDPLLPAPLRRLLLLHNVLTEGGHRVPRRRAIDHSADYSR